MIDPTPSLALRRHLSRSSHILILAACSISILTTLATVAAQTNPTPSPIDFFEQRIRPILANQCYECHGAKQQKGGLRLDSREGLLKGGDSGPTLVPSDAKKSLLIQEITLDHPHGGAPKDRLHLSDSVIADFLNWVNQGAPDPRDQPPTIAATANGSWDSIFRERKNWWSFKPIHKTTVPSVVNAAWSDHPVDRFLLAKLEERALAPAASADRRILLRRVTLALIGLPPTPAEVRAFVEDLSPNAYEKLVDRLLVSPRFGERWARHWMDLVRFAETHGSEGDPDIPNAWRYRDYLIRAFNADVPYDQLIREHLAGDMLPAPRWNKDEGINESLLGLAHLRMVEHGFQPVDTLDEQVKTVENQIDIVSKAFQGLTIACARCHDHKFDPISQRDYYALYGIFASCRPAQVTIDAPERLRVNRGELEKLKTVIKIGVADAWAKSASQLSEHLLTLLRNGTTNRLPIVGDEIRDRIHGRERRIAQVTSAGRSAVLRKRGVASTGENSLTPMAAWTFDGNARDSLGALHGQLEGGAVIRNGRLVLDGKGAFVSTPPLERALREKTLEVWVALANLDQRGGGAISVESANGSVFDAIVFAEQEPRKWIAGSDGFRRTRSANGPVETIKPDELVHLAIVYSADNTIALFRNGTPHGLPYTPTGDNSTLRTFGAKSTHILFGRRHTGGGNPFLAGEIEEARLYDRSLSANEIATSFRAGPGLVSPEEIAEALTTDQREEQKRLLAEIEDERTALANQFPDYAQRDAARSRMISAFDAAAKNENYPLNIWFQLRDKSGEAFASGWQAFTKKQEDELSERKKFNDDTFKLIWNLSSEGAKLWFQHGLNPPEAIARPGDFSVEPESERVLAGLLPAGVFSHRLSQRHNGIFSSPRFKVESDSISVRALGGKGARVRLITDNYPLGSGGIFPQAALNSETPTWVRLDTSYRKGSMAYLEFATAEDLTSRDRSAPGPGGSSFFGVERVVFHDGKAPPKDEAGPLTHLLRGEIPKSPEEFAIRIGEELTEAVAAWRGNSLNEKQRVFLDTLLRGGLLPASLKELPSIAPLVTEYRRLEAAIPLPRRSPGVLESEGYDAPLLSRGDHTRPMEPVPRAYLQLVSGRPYETTLSGRLELANELASAANPLTARVMVNRVWHHLFGRGLVATVDNFGHMGDRPSHPELLDFLAKRFVDQRWSVKDLIRFLVTTRAYQMSSEGSARAQEIDPGNELLSHARMRRIEAEAIRDSLLAVSGRLDLGMFGPGANALAPPAEQRRRSVYMTIRRNFLSPFLETFDAPKPFTTLGRRDATNVPAQSLALLNDPFIIELAAQWAASVLRDTADGDARVRLMFEEALARFPTNAELAGSRAYLADLVREHGINDGQQVWRDFAQSLFNLKEFIYVR